MNLNQKIIKPKLGLLELAKSLGSISSACKVSLSNKKGPVNCTKKGPLYVKIFMSNDLQIYSY
ncbi:hypothetical protein [Rickettsia endosymbiont of Nabis limbatus]|uniref:hypothetical protein n=1 Tax=Rickettsia endosymbiont of Nabis limbatus TaxID=3066268 RepID=UPI003AF3B33A